LIDSCGLDRYPLGELSRNAQTLATFVPETGISAQALDFAGLVTWDKEPLIFAILPDLRDPDRLAVVLAEAGLPEAFQLALSGGRSRKRASAILPLSVPPGSMEWHCNRCEG